MKPDNMTEASEFDLEYEQESFDEFDAVDDVAEEWLAELKDKDVYTKDVQEIKNIKPEENPQNLTYTPRNYNLQTLHSQIYSEDLNTIRQIEPNLRLSKIQDIPNFTAFAQYKAKGYDTKDAYFLANKENIENKKIASAKQAAYNAHSKDHLKKFGGSAGKLSDYVDIPADQLNFYREAFPDDSPAKLKIRYNKIRKRQGDF